MKNKIAIIQSNYIPWKGYFDIIAKVDEFILYDDVQYTRRDWRNRNKIKTPNGTQWLTVPVKVKGKYSQTIRDTEIDGSGWAKKHWNTIVHNYHRAAHFEEIASIFKPLYLETDYLYLSDLNKTFIKAVCSYLDINTKISNSWDYTMVKGKTERLVSLCEQTGGVEYISGPAAKDYIDEQIFAHRGITLTWYDYDGYPEYNQLWNEFIHSVTILDLLFNCGKDAPRYMKEIRT